MKNLCVVMMLVVAPAFGAIIRPNLISSTNLNSFHTANDLYVGNTGLSVAVDDGDTLAFAQSATHLYGGSFNDSWVTNNGFGADYFGGGASTPVFVWDLGRDYDLDNVLLWQYQNSGGGAGNNGNHARTIDFQINTAAEGAVTFAGGVIGITMLPVVDGDANGANDLGGTNSAQTFGLGGVRGRYVQMTVTDNYRGFQGITGGGDRVGLGEIRFDGVVPEPGTWALFGVFLVLGLGVRRRLGRSAA